MPCLDLTSLEAYAESCRRIADEDFDGLGVAEVAAQEEDYNAYPRLDLLQPPKDLLILEDHLTDALRDRARRAVLDGRVFWEHAAAGEATRLKLGPKYLIHPHRLPPSYTGAGPAADPDGTPDPRGLLPMVLGARHLWQLVFEITRLSEEAGRDPKTVLARQKMLVIVNERERNHICARFRRVNFLGLPPDRLLFLVQPNFHGLTPGPEGWRFDAQTPARLHNHGQMAMQKTMDRQVFHLGRDGREHRLSRAEFFGLLDECADLVSYNIEDLDYLTRALDFDTIGQALRLGDQGYGMSMEIVANNPEHPVKGGLCAHDPALGRDVVVESFRLRGLEPRRITHLNKNFNHYPHPGLIFRRLHEEGIFMPVTVKDGAVYFQPVQGDLNFLVKTACLARRVPTVLHSWKAPEDTPAALAAMARQDAQPGFADFVAAVAAKD